MITLITGPIHSGKTTRLISEYTRCKNGDGFASPKLIENDVVKGFDLLRLSSGQIIPLVRRKDFTTKDWRQCCSYGPYSFSEDAVNNVNEAVDEMLKREDITIFLDEIGSLELADRCFNETVLKIRNAGVDAVFTVRDTNLQDVLN